MVGCIIGWDSYDETRYLMNDLLVLSLICPFSWMVPCRRSLYYLDEMRSFMRRKKEEKWMERGREFVFYVIDYFRHGER